MTKVTQNLPVQCLSKSKKYFILALFLYKKLQLSCFLLPFLLCTGTLPVCVLVLISCSPLSDWPALTAPPGGDGCDSAGVSRVGSQPSGRVHPLRAQVGHIAVHPQLVVKQSPQRDQRSSPADVQLVPAKHHHHQPAGSMVLDVSCADLHFRKGSGNVCQPHCTYT